MDTICRFRKNMVFPEKLLLDQVESKSSEKCSRNWCSGSEDRSNLCQVIQAPNSNRIDNAEDDFIENRFMNNANFEEANRKFIQDRIRHLVNAFSTRAEVIKEAIKSPATPSSAASRESLDADQPPSPKPKLSVSFANKYEDTRQTSLEELDHPYTFCDSGVIDPNEKFYIVWMSIASISVLYNAWVIPLRSTFPYQTPQNRAIWMMFDYLADTIYLADMIFIQPRIQYLQDGFWVTDRTLLRNRYMKSIRFKLDLVSLSPLDLLYFFISPEIVLVRFPRFFKIHAFTEFCSFVDKLLPSPYIIRLTKTLMYMMYLIHLNACAYYAFSSWEGIGRNAFVYSGEGNAYIKCFYFATKTATSIGKNPKPTQEWEYIFMTFSWLLGVFVFALLIGQIRDIISTATRSRTDFKKLVDETLQCMRRLSLPQDVQKRVKLWFNYTWETQRALDENKILECLPHKMKTDIAINVHIKTLNKVKLFADCDEAILRELVLKLKSVIYLPGDIICKKGDVGKEMYIVQSGKVEVIGSSDNVLATLSEGSVFGEISLLGIPGMNRRTADVRSKGYSNLFVLSKADLNAALSHYPEAQELLNKKAKALMKKNASLERKCKDAMIVINNPTTPAKDAKLLETVLQILPPESNTNKLLRFGSRGKPRTNPQYDKFKQSRNSLPLPSLLPLKRELQAMQKENRRSDKWKPNLTGHTFQCPVTVHRSMS